jgi:hypothetical protein
MFAGFLANVSRRGGERIGLEVVLCTHPEFVPRIVNLISENHPEK